VVGISGFPTLVVFLWQSIAAGVQVDPKTALPGLEVPAP
jgi:hypothetical protein